MRFGLFIGRLGGLGLLLLAGVTQPACGVFFSSSGPSLVGQGKYYASANARYDRFFVDLYDLQVEMGRAPGENDAIKTKLAKSLSYPSTADQVLLEKLKQDAKQQAQKGLLVLPVVEKRDPNCMAPDKPSETVLMKTSSPTSGAYVSAIEAAANELVSLRDRMRVAQERSEKLRATAVLLGNQVEEEFRVEGPAKRDEVNKNLADAERLVPLMTSRAASVASSAQSLLDQLLAAVKTDNGSLSAPAEAAPSDTEVKASKPHAGGRGSRPSGGGATKPAGGGGGAAKPAPAPAPAPAGGGFEP